MKTLYECVRCGKLYESKDIYGCRSLGYLLRTDDTFICKNCWKDEHKVDRT